MLKNKIIFTNKMKRNRSMVLRETCILVIQAYRQNNDGHIPVVYTVEEANTTCQLTALRPKGDRNRGLPKGDKTK